MHRKVIAAMGIAVGVGTCPMVSLGSPVTLAGYNFDLANASAASYSATTQDLSVSVGDVTRGSGFDTTSSTQAPNSMEFRPANRNTHNSIATAGSDYVTFTIAPVPGQSINFAELTFTGGFQNTNDDDQPDISYSIDGTTFNEVTPASTTGGGGTQGGGSITYPITGNFDLSGISNLQDDTAAVSFRLYLLSTSNGYDTEFIGGVGNANGIAVTGTPVAAPEPMALSMLAACGFLGLTRRRRARV